MRIHSFIQQKLPEASISYDYNLIADNVYMYNYNINRKDSLKIILDKTKQGKKVSQIKDRKQTQSSRIHRT